jgi:hypothetical protein
VQSDAGSVALLECFVPRAKTGDQHRVHLDQIRDFDTSATWRRPSGLRCAAPEGRG